MSYTMVDILEGKECIEFIEIKPFILFYLLLNYDLIIELGI